MTVNPLSLEVAAHLAIIPRLNEQLAETSRQVESAVLDICANFSGIADKARRGVEATIAIVDSTDGHDGFTVLLDRMQDTVAAADARLAATAARSLRAIERLQQVEQSLRGVHKTLDHIEELAAGLRLLAINAKIEAVRSGERGSGFAVVADEMQRAGKESRELAEHIREGVAQMTGEAAELSTLLREGAQEDLASIEQSREAFAIASEAMARNHAMLRDSIREGTDLSRALAEDVSAAIVGLQFQDRVNQRLLHVSEALTHMRDTLGQALPAGDDDAARQRLAEVEARLERSYTMWEERADGAPDSGDIELF
ncbi:hypothetical protein TBR22_A43230 [Luteitalea sp. TBR-22]|uniref:methyl-accepting chemotaxis protein n=1 Tax=Luteitalea sp. TBR-22 TaxID=2802971 RepID=UPI001AF06ADE|nr:methyl-accepting chemotaxis protein [Luteitalea sp. TBR-22]BCS35097.1 hypothetical protein TBR22_A43230 [Luteitalea sp. TBR-22]